VSWIFIGRVGVRESASYFQVIQEYLSDLIVRLYFIAGAGFLFRSLIWGILGIFSIFVVDRYSAWRRIILLVLGSSVFYVFFGAVFYIFIPDLYELMFLIWPIHLIYFITAVLFGYYFPFFKPRLKNIPRIFWILAVLIPLLYLIFSFFYSLY
jgi:hypothetical protein